MNQRLFASGAACGALVLALVACGGGGGGGAASATGSANPPGATSAAVSSGTITAFGSVFVDGHEFATGAASVVDDDSGLTTAGVAGLEVGQMVDVDAASNSTAASPVASLLHVHPLARGYVDADDTIGGTLTVMGQTVELSSATLYSDHRACVMASSNPCTAIASASGLATTTSTGGTTTPGSYVSIDGYLFDAGGGVTNIVATLVSVHDAPSSSSVAAFKAEGVVSAVGTGTITIGGLTVNLASATCRALGSSATSACGSTFSVGQVASAFSSSSPSLPATTLTAHVALLRTKLPVQAAGATVEFEGSVSAFTAASGSAAATFTVRGVEVDTSGLPAGTSLPATGDIVQIVGTVSSDGNSVSASAIRIVRAARSASDEFEGDASAVAAGASASTYTLTLMGESITISAQTRLADRSSGGWFNHDPQTDPFNISTFQTYLAASSSQHLIVQTAKDSSGVLQALSLTIVPASTVARVAGTVDASPAPVAGTASAPATFSIAGLPVSAATSAIGFAHRGSTAVAAGDEVEAAGAYAAGVFTVGPSASDSNEVFDLGLPWQPDMPGF